MGVARLLLTAVWIAGIAEAVTTAQHNPVFVSATHCMTCHNNLSAADGEDISLGTAWRPSMMAHSAIDPYWHAGVRREVVDHPQSQAAIEHECSRCHMPMAHAQTELAGARQTVFAHIPGASAAADPFAAEGVSCTLCHQIERRDFGERSSFNGRFVVDTRAAAEQRRAYGPFEVDSGKAVLMQSVTGFTPSAAAYMQQSELCATCHTLYTHAIDSGGGAREDFPEQMPYREWLHSEFRSTKSCQACHMPEVAPAAAIASVIGEPRDQVSRHDFRGANFLMLRILNRYRHELGVVAGPAEIDLAIARTMGFLESSAARIEVAGWNRTDTRLEADVHVRNLAGHKLPTGYPSRRAWLHVTVTDSSGRTIFSSGSVGPDGAIAGNDNDADAARFEPHYREIRAPEEVQIYEAIMGTAARTVTTGLLSAVVYLKDNRLVPLGFDKRQAADDVAVHGSAYEDADFGNGEDRVRYSIDISRAQAPFTIDARLMYQSIGYRWAQNLRRYQGSEPQRFVRYYDSVAAVSAATLARDVVRRIGAK